MEVMATVMDMDMGRSKGIAAGRALAQLARRRAGMPVSALLMLGFASGAIAAQGWDFKPRVTASEIYTDNVTLAPSGMEDDDLITEITPGFSLLRESSRLKLNMNYRMQTLFFADDSDANRINHRLEGKMNAELTDDFLFLDARAHMSQALVDARGARPADSITGSNNLTDVQAYSISPYIRHDFSGYMSTLLRYGYETVDTDGAVQASETNFVNAEFGSGRKFALLRWNLNYFKSNADRGSSASLDEERSTANILYQIHPKFALQAQGGREENDLNSSEVARNGTYWGVGATYTPSRYLSLSALEGNNFTSGSVILNPSVRTTLQTSYREREVGLNPGSVWSGAFRHRTRRTLWQMNYLEDTQTTQRLFFDTQRLQSNLLAIGIDNDQEFQLLSALFPDLANAYINDSFSLKEEIFERKRGQAGVSFQTGKSTIGVSLFTERRDYLDSTASLAQSSIVEDEKSHGGFANWAWRYSGRTRTNLRGNWERVKFSSDGREDDFWYIDAMVTRDLSRSASGSIAYRYTRNESDLPGDEYAENRLTARLSIEF